VPDEASLAGATKLAGLVDELSQDDLVIALISGGASALLVGLPDGVSLDDKKSVTKALLSCGAPISEINTVRKHISTIKGGRLAQLAAPAHVVTFAVSDIPGDDIAAIGSGPTVSDNTAPRDALGILNRYAIVIPDAIARCLELAQTEVGEMERAAGRSEAHLVVKPSDSLAAAAAQAEAAGYRVINLGDDLEGEASELGAAHARLALELQAKGERACLLSGGETTVTLKAMGRGGRNTEYLLGLAFGLTGQPGIAALAADTDGVDGSEDNAGALIFPSTIARADAKGLDPAASLATNDSYGFFEAIKDLLITGPTLTNVNDFRVILIDPLESVVADNDHGGQA
jgi:hydroxypyruvate reductase